MTEESINQRAIIRENTARFIDGLLDDYDAATRDLHAQYEREELLLQEIATRNATITALSAELECAKERQDNAEVGHAKAAAALEKLERTKALRLQRYYWRLKNSLRRPNAR